MAKGAPYRIKIKNQPTRVFQSEQEMKDALRNDTELRDLLKNNDYTIEKDEDGQYVVPESSKIVMYETILMLEDKKKKKKKEVEVKPEETKVEVKPEETTTEETTTEEVITDPDQAYEEAYPEEKTVVKTDPESGVQEVVLTEKNKEQEKEDFTDFMQIGKETDPVTQAMPKFGLFGKQIDQERVYNYWEKKLQDMTIKNEEEVLDRAVAEEMELVMEMDSKLAETVESYEDKIKKLTDEKEGLEDGKKKVKIQKQIDKLQTKKNEVLEPVRKKIKDKKQVDIFNERLARVEEISKQIFGEQFEFDIAETGEEYVEKFELDLIRQVEDLDVLINETTDPKKKNELYEQRRVIQNELNELEGYFLNEKGELKFNESKRENKLKQLKEKTHGNMSVDGMRAVINVAASLSEGGNINVAAHEFLHKLLLNTIRNNDNIRIVLGSSLHKYIAKIDPNLVQNSDFRRRLVSYGNNMDLINELVEQLNKARQEGNTELAKKLEKQRVKLEGSFENGSQAEEVLTLFSDAIYYNEVTFNENLYTKLGDMFRRIFRSFGITAKWGDPRDVYNFIRDYNNTIETGRGVAALIKEGRKGVTLKGDIKQQIDIESGDAPKKRRRKKRFTIFQSKSDAESVNNIYQEKGKDGAFEIAEEYRGMANKIYDRYVSQLPRDLQAWIKQQDNFREDLINGILFASYGFINKGTANRSVVGMVQNEFVEAKQTYGNLAAYINKFISLRAIQEFKDNLPQESKLPEPTDPTETKPEEQVRKGKMALKELKQEETQEDVKNIVRTSGVKLPAEPSYKDVKNLITSHDGAKKSKRVPTGELFPVLEKICEDLFGDASIALRLVREVDFTKSQRAAIQDYIRRKHVELITYVIPEGTSKEGKATGAANTKLGVLYTEGARTKTGPGLKEQKKLHIDPAFLLEQAGMVKGQPTITTTKVDPFLRSMAIQIGVIASNQAIRQQKEYLNLTELQVIRLKDGKPKLAYSQAASGNVSWIKQQLDKGDFDTINKINKLLGNKKLILDPMNTNHVKQMEFFVTDVLAKHLPWEFVNAASFGVGTKKNTGQFFTAEGGAKAGTRIKLQNKVKKYQSKNPLNLTEKQIKSVKLAIRQKRGYGKGGWYDRHDFNSSSYQEIIKDHNEGVKIILNALQDIVNIDNGKYLPEIAAIFKSQAYATDHFIRQMAIPKGKEQGIGVNNTYSEHFFPSGKMSELILRALINNEINDLIPFMQDSYYQIGLTSVTNKKIDNLYKEGFPKEYYDVINEKLKEGFSNLPDPIIRYAHSNINLNKITLNNNNTLPQNYGLAYAETNSSFELIATINTLLQELSLGQISQEKAINILQSTLKISYSKNSNKEKILDLAIQNARANYNNPRGMSTFDFDETLIDKGENFIIATKDNKTIKISSGQWPVQGPELAKQGYKFDFSDFINVRGGIEGPLLEKMRNQIKKFGPQNVFVLTARPPQSAPAIHEWLKTRGINIPYGNITGLGNSTGEAKAEWMLEKFAEGYNDMYFVDDALSNVKAVKNVLEQLDIKSKVVQVKINYSKEASKRLNEIIEQSTGVDAKKRFSEAQAKLKGDKFKVRDIVPPSAQDFLGLLYNMLPKGKQGEEAMEYFKKTLIDPFARGVNELNTAKQRAATEFAALLKTFPDVKSDLKKKLKNFEGVPKHIGNYKIDHAIRVYLWNKAGYEVPGLSKRDLNELIDFVKQDEELRAFADAVGNISKNEKGYAEPGEYWLVENIQADLLSDGAIGEVRGKYLTEWQNNVDLMFTPENMRKLKAIYGSKYVEALQDILYRMKTGRNRPSGANRLANMYMNWVNNSVGAIMFFNIRSAVLQTISSVNYINWTDNNPLKAGLALANQKQFWKDFVYIFNSDMLKQRRAGNRRGVNESELLNAVIGSNNPIKASIAWLLNKGFLPTQIADSFAIASGGATFYRNRVNTYLKQGMSQQEAEQKAWLDFQEVTEVSQQSARPDLISQQQANPLGRLILAFANTPMQYGRIMNKAFRDIINRRGDTKTHVSKIVYYGVVQSVIFTSLQSAIFAALGEEDEELLDKKKDRMFNGIIDSWLTTFGYGGKAISTLKNTLMEYKKQDLKDTDDNYFSRSDHAYTILQALSFSPPIGSKLRKIYQSTQTRRYNRDIIKERGFTLDNPIWGAVGHVIEGVTNIPLGRLSNKMLNLDNALDTRNESWKRIALIMGWNTWDLGIKDPDLQALGEDIKERKKREKEMEKERKKVEKEREKLREKYPDKTDEQIDEAVITEKKIKQIFDLNKREQVKIIEGLNLNPKDYPKEQDRVDIIMENYDEDSEKMDSTLTAIENYVPSETEQRSIDLFKMNKKDQINLLMQLGLNSKAIKKLKYEEDRVNKILQLEEKEKSK